VDVFGQPADWDVLREIASTYGLGLIEDSCEALGAEYKGRKAGTLADSAVFAFYPNKQITTGEGGMIVTDDDQAAKLMRALRNQGRAPGDTWLQHTYLGYNYRLDDMSAALGAAQMRRLEELLVKRERVAGWYHNRLEKISGVQAPCIDTTTTRASWFVYVIRVDPRIERGALAQRLAERGIPVRPYFLPIHLQPYMVERFGNRPGDYPITDDLGERGLALPFSGVMTEEQSIWSAAPCRKSCKPMSNALPISFQPPRRRGLLLHALVGLGSMAATAASLIFALQLQGKGIFVVLLLVALVFFIPLPVVSYRAYALYNASTPWNA